MRVQKLFAILLACIFVFAARPGVLPASAADVHVVDLMPSFLAAVRGARSLPEHEQPSAFRRSFIAPNASVLAALGQTQISDPEIAGFLHSVTDLDAWNRVAAQLTPDRIAAYSAAVQSLFPGQTWSGSVYVLPAGGGGWSIQPVNGVLSILVSVDALVRDGASANIGAQFEEQLAQLYLGQAVPALAKTNSLYAVAWQEAFGILAARQLNSGLALSALAPREIAEHGAAYLPEAARLYLTAFDSSDLNVINTLYAQDQPFAFFPPDMGDAVSYRVATDVGAKHRLAQLLHLQGGDLREVMQRELKAICASECASLDVPASPASASSSDPAAVKFVTADVTNFWHAYDDAQRHPAQAAQIYRREYFDRGTVGLIDFIPNRLISPAYLAEKIAQQAAYYAAIRPYTMQFERQRAQTLAYFARLKRVYPAAHFPDVYFVVGRMNSGGTLSGDGLLMGAEMHALPPHFTQAQLGKYPIANLAASSAVPPTIVHELVHYQQQYGNGGNALLRQTIDEGSADFVAQLVTGTDPDAFLFQYGCDNEKQLWQTFTKDMAAPGNDAITDWLYSLKPSFGAPRFIGYWVGYRIVQTYYDRAADKAQALRDILHVKDAGTFLQASGYPGSAASCAQQPAAKV